MTSGGIGSISALLMPRIAAQKSPRAECFQHLCDWMKLETRPVTTDTVLLTEFSNELLQLADKLPAANARPVARAAIDYIIRAWSRVTPSTAGDCADLILEAAIHARSLGLSAEVRPGKAQCFVFTSPYELLLVLSDLNVGVSGEGLRGLREFFAVACEIADRRLVAPHDRARLPRLRATLDELLPSLTEEKRVGLVEALRAFDSHWSSQRIPLVLAVLPAFRELARSSKKNRLTTTIREFESEIVSHLLERQLALCCSTEPRGNVRSVQEQLTKDIRLIATTLRKGQKDIVLGTLAKQSVLRFDKALGVGHLEAKVGLQALIDLIEIAKPLLGVGEPGPKPS